MLSGFHARLRLSYYAHSRQRQLSMWAVSRSGGAGSSIDSDVTSAHVIESHNLPSGCTTTPVYEMVGGGGLAFVALIPSSRLTADS